MPGMMAPQQRQFNPYSENGGTILAIAGADFSVIAGDTRQTEGFNIQTRYAPKVFRLCVFELELHWLALALTCSVLRVFKSFTMRTWFGLNLVAFVVGCAERTRLFWQ